MTRELQISNLTIAGLRVIAYDFENQLTNMHVASKWRIASRHDAFVRRWVRKEDAWQSSAWMRTNKFRYLDQTMLVMQERHANTLTLVSYTRGNDLSNCLEGKCRKGLTANSRADSRGHPLRLLSRRPESAM